MAQLNNGSDDIESSRIKDENALQTDIQRLPSFHKSKSSLSKKEKDVTYLGAEDRHLFIEKIIKHIEHDNFQLLENIRKRIDKVGIKLAKVEVRYQNLCVKAECEVVQGKPLPTLWNTFKSIVSGIASIPGLKSQITGINIIHDCSGIIKPGRMTLLLGPPGCGKTTFLKALSGNLDKSLKVSGEVCYNGYDIKEIVPQKTASYVGQNGVHFPEMTVRETIDFSSCCQGVGSRAETLRELVVLEKEGGIFPDPDIETFMKAICVEGKKTSLQTDYILKILGLDTCADTLVGDAMTRGISGGQKKRLTIGEMIVGPARALFMDEISNGLDSSTTYQIVACLQQQAHITDATILISLLQPAPETFDLFDDIILMGEGKIVFQGPRDKVLEFFESCGFICPERKGVADFLQEVLSRKDQAQYWNRTEEIYRYVSVDMLLKKFKESIHGNKMADELSKPFMKSTSQKNAISSRDYFLPRGELFKTCLSREVLLMKRNSFLYKFKTVQITISASVSMTVFFRTTLSVDLLHANYYLGALYYALFVLLIDGYPELAMTLKRLAVFYKQRDFYFYPAWAYAVPACIMKSPLSLLEAVIWTSLTYYVIGYSPELGRFFRQLLIFFGIHMVAMSMYRFLSSMFRTIVGSLAAASFWLMFVILFSGFVIPTSKVPYWLKWGFWVSPLAYGEIGLAVNEFLAPRWQKMLLANTTIGHATLKSRGLDFDGYFFWVSVGALFGFTLILNVGFTGALTFLNPFRSRAIISTEELSLIQGYNESADVVTAKDNSKESSKGKLVLPFKPLTLAFRNVQYFVDTPLMMKERGYMGEKVQLLNDISGAFRPGVLTALMGVSGAGKTTLLDVLAGRKTSGTVEGEIRIGGYPKVPNTFARVSGYCEQTDVHSSQITVEESLIFSAWLRLDPQIDSNTKYEFVKEVLETIELDGIKDRLVGESGASGLSTEQRRRLTIAVELVANPSIIFLDEPTTGLDARAAAIVMRAVKNVVNTGRTTVCTIHQPSIDIFESFDELILLKSGGRMIYSGPLGHQSHRVIEYFEGISGVPKIKSKYNPATWMLEVSSGSSEAELGLDFAQIFKNSPQYKENQELVEMLSVPSENSKDLHFPTLFPQNGWGQFKACLWKQHLSYWRSPSYNLKRFFYTFMSSLVFGLLFWDQGKKIENQQSLFTILGSMFVSLIFGGILTCSAVAPYISMERIVLYRERFSGMYGSWAYAAAQVTIEIPYSIAQTITFTAITYPMIGYYWSVYKVLWYAYTMFCTLLYYNYLGMVVVAISPSYAIATTIQSACFTLFNLFSGYLIPRPQIPKWWVWIYYLIPSSWTLNAALTSQYGDIEKEIMVFGKSKTVSAFIGDYFGFHHNQLPLVAVVLISYPIIFTCLFSFCISKLNFQKR